jgi:8-amino-7-oxononanoate synthase
MPETLDQFCRRSLDVVKAEGLKRHLRLIESPQSSIIRINGREYQNFSSNDYLGLANHPEIKIQAAQAMETFGTGAGASPLISGFQPPLSELQKALADLKGAESSLVFNSGYSTAIGTIPALFGPNDILILDKLCHASLIDGVRKSGAKLRIFRHNDTDDLEKKLKWATSQLKASSAKESSHIGIIVESVYSMDGDRAPLKRIVELKQSHGAWIMVDEAHATGLFGEQGKGLIQQEGLSEDVEVQMGTLGKALGCSGGFITGSKWLINFLINKARSFIFSTALSPMVSAAALASVQMIKSKEGDSLRKTLFDHIRTFHEAVGDRWKNSVDSTDPGLHQSAQLTTPILPWWVGEAEKAVQLSQALMDRGLFVPAIRYPTVPPNTSRLRITLSASHSKSAIETLAKQLVQCHEQLNLRT